MIEKELPVHCVSLKIRLILKIRPSMNFHDDFKIRPTLKISPS